MKETEFWSGYLRDARVRRIQKAAEQCLSVVRADGGRGIGEEVIVEHALSEKLVKESGRVGRAQGASEPGVLNGNIHSDWRQFGLAWLGSGWQLCPISAASSRYEAREVMQDREENVKENKRVKNVLQRVLSSAPRLPALYIPGSQKERL